MCIQIKRALGALNMKRVSNLKINLVFMFLKPL